VRAIESADYTSGGAAAVAVTPGRITATTPVYRLVTLAYAKRVGDGDVQCAMISS
jgi:hypothetical protein